MRWLLGALSMVWMACGSGAGGALDEVSADAVEDALEVADVAPFGGDFHAEQHADRSIVLRRRGEVLTTLDASRIELGVVSDQSIVDDWNWDPWWLIAGDTLAQLAEVPPELSFVPLATSGLDVAVTLEQVADDRFHVRIVPSADAAGAIVYVRVTLAVTADERFYGGGNRHGAIELRGAKLAMQLEPDLDYKTAYNERHVPVPLILSTRGWAVFSASERAQAFDIAASDAAALTITVGVGGAAEDGLDLWLFAADDALDLLKPYYQTTAFPRVPPEWGFGPWYWRDEIAGQAAVIDDFVKIRELRLPASAYWIDRPYASAVNTFDFAPADYPDPTAMFAAARALSILPIAR